MSKYTTEVRYICEFEAGETESQGQSHIDTILTEAAPKIFNFDYPIFDENYRIPLEKKILRHYYTREISEETVGLWKLRLEDKMNIIMPYYNQLYSSELIKFNPMYDVDLTRQRSLQTEGNEETSGSGSENINKSDIKSREQNVDTDTSNTDTTNTLNTQTSEGTSENTNERNLNRADITTDKGNTIDSATRWDLYSDTPQGGINGITADNDSVANNTYLTNARKISDSRSTDITNNGTNDTTETGTINDSGSSRMESTSVGSNRATQSGTVDSNISETENNASIGNRETRNSGSKEINNSEEYFEHVVGKQGVQTYSKLLMEFRNTFLNIDKMVIDELNDLFFGLWG